MSPKESEIFQSGLKCWNKTCEILPLCVNVYRDFVRCPRVVIFHLTKCSGPSLWCHTTYYFASCLSYIHIRYLHTYYIKWKCILEDKKQNRVFRIYLSCLNNITELFKITEDVMKEAFWNPDSWGFLILDKLVELNCIFLGATYFWGTSGLL